MKALSVVFALVVAMGFGWVGCNDDAEPLVAPDTRSDAVTLEKGWWNLHSAAGSGLVFIFDQNPTYRYKAFMAFAAFERLREGFCGALDVHDFEQKLSFQAKLVDLKVVSVEGGRQAKMSWEVKYTKGFPPEWPTLTHCFIVIQDNDDGEGEFHTGINCMPAAGWLGHTPQQFIDMTVEEYITLRKDCGTYGEWARQYGEWTVR